ncbi:MAG: 4-phosphoerythronate dehydrogenase [Bacteroidales bacterium]|nr:4-phosphoerythronate dehydrogenase [Bacteroidales bacterium]
MKSKIIIDSAIPFIEGLFEPYADVLYLPSDRITRDVVADADVLVTRTRTKCNKELLEGSSVKMIASATIGTDHIDVPWCDKKGIIVRNAPGCNAGGVMEYVFCALYGVASRRRINLSGKTIGVIGVGNVGKRVVGMSRALGFKTLLCDPPRAAEEGDFDFTPLDELLEKSDIITMHVPLDKTTRNMVDKKFFKKIKKGAIFINASRGEVVDEQALIEAIPNLGPVIIDTWQHEPDINKELMEMVDIATPHIAGYSYQGKMNATAAVVRAVARFLKIYALYEFFPADDRPESTAVKLELAGLSQGEIASVLSYNYPIFTDDFLFRLEPDNFEKFREEYNYRREIYVDYK